METLKLGPLKVRMTTVGEGEPTGKPPLVVVLAHGFGAPGDDLVGLAGVLDLPPDTTLVFPEALHSLRPFVGLMSAEARAWWMIDIERLERAISRKEPRVLMDDVPEGLAEAREAYDGMLDAIAERFPESRLVIGGFSQGAMLSLDVALRNPDRELAGVVQLSGTFLAAHEWTPRMPGRRGMPVFQSHGDSDPILPRALAETLRDALVGAGLAVTFDGFRGGHTILEATVDQLGSWLRALP
jgi:phospholipase/carboxylesterase